MKIESFNPALESSITTFQKLSDELGPWRVQWRYDPILLSTATPPAYHLERCEGIARRLEGYTGHCTFSFVDYYGKTRRNLGRVERQTGIRFLQPSPEEQGALLEDLAEIGAAHGIRLYSCCGDALASGKVQKNRCIDPDLVRRLAPWLDEYPGLKPTREQCGCIASVDIGVYDTCLFGCTYFYATNDRPAAQRRHAAHDPHDSVLWRPEELRGKVLEEEEIARG